MRALKLTSIRKASWLPVIAMAMSFAMVTGLFLNCCRINESISAGVGEFLTSLGHSGGHGSPSAIAGSSHPGCHGHGKPAESRTQPAPDNGPGAHVESDEACLSELAIAPKALQSNPLDFSGLFQESPFHILVAHITLPPPFGQLKPQNKSSPPLYLLTLRILV